jgi:hypothetical protein
MLESSGGVSGIFMLLAEYPFIHASYNASGMRLGKVSVPLHHLQCFVTQNFRYFSQACPIHSEIGCCTMT